MSTQKFGVIGLEVMGRNLALNIERNGYPIAVYNRTTSKSEDFLTDNPGRNIKMGATYEEFVGLLERPRRILVMVKAGNPVDYVLNDLKPLLEPGDIVIDGGNSLYTDTERRAKDYQETGLSFFGMGVSGGEEGALWGPSLMPGGTEESYQDVEDILKKIAAKAPEDGEPCVTYLGRGGSGHFVKMVHNGIEYGDMQLIAESYDLLKHVGGLTNAELADVFAEWNQGDDLKSFLIEITAKILNFRNEDSGGEPLVELILDSAGQKGTGRWTVIAAMELGVAVPTISAAVDARTLSAHKDQRIKAARELAGPNARAGVNRPYDRDKQQLIDDVRAALYCSKICSYAQGFTLLAAADKAYDFGLRMNHVAEIWRAGCIIRAVFLNDITKAMNENPDSPNLLLAERFKEAIARRQEAWRRVTKLAVEQGVPVPGFSGSLAYYDSYRSEKLPANLIQAQRDFFGAHTYLRTDKQGGPFHTEWEDVTSRQPTQAE
ncbi:MAG: NADP-dependent phosphogluconate dehydrogenase [Phycisphaerae bacterium]